MVFGFFKKKQKEKVEEDEELEPVSFMGPLNGEDVNLKAHAKLVEAGLVPAKDLVTDALDQGAESLKIEPKAPGGQVTFYLDGMPQSGGKLGKSELQAISQVLKLVAGMDPKERKAVQTGGMKGEFDGKKFIFRVTSSPVAEGERILVRIHDQSHKLDSLQELGMGEAMRTKLRDLSCSPGVILSCGPAGSGTTTTKFGLLRNVDSYIYSVYSMVEPEGRTLHHVSDYDDGVIGESLEDSLVRLSRREANVVLVEPLKGANVAKPVFNLAEKLMLISEVPAKDPALAVHQLVQLVGDAGMVAERLKAIVTQKMLRRLCKACRLAYRPKLDFLKKLGLDETVKSLYRVPPPPDDPKDDDPCEKCDATGYLGRVAMFEMLEVTPGIKEVIQAGADPEKLRAQLKKEKQLNLQQDGVRLVAEGVTSLEELQRVFKNA